MPWSQSLYSASDSIEGEFLRNPRCKETVVSYSSLLCPNIEKIQNMLESMPNQDLSTTYEKYKWAAEIRVRKLCRPFQFALGKVYLLVAAFAHMGSVKLI